MQNSQLLTSSSCNQESTLSSLVISKLHTTLIDLKSNENWSFIRHQHTNLTKHYALFLLYIINKSLVKSQIVSIQTCNIQQPFNHTGNEGNVNNYYCIITCFLYKCNKSTHNKTLQSFNLSISFSLSTCLSPPPPPSPLD